MATLSKTLPFPPLALSFSSDTLAARVPTPPTLKTSRCLTCPALIASLSATVLVKGPLSNASNFSALAGLAAINDPSSTFTFDMLDFYYELLNRNKDESTFHTIVSANANDAGLNPEIVHFSNFLWFSYSLALQYPYEDVTADLLFWGILKKDKAEALRKAGRDA